MKKRKVKIFIMVLIMSLLPLANTSDQQTLFALDESTGWYPFSVPWEVKKNNVTDIGKIVLDAPAGKHGFVKTKDGHFYFEDGSRIRFFGANLVFGANYPSHDNAENMADKLAKSGFNIVRMHHMDGGYPTIFQDPDNNTLQLSAEKLDRLDYLIYQLKLRGIYVDINLHTSRKFTSADGVVAAENILPGSKFVTFIDDHIISLQKDYAKSLLTHYNPYTKINYSAEPSIALIEVNNENSLFTAWSEGELFGNIEKSFSGYVLPEYYIQQLDLKWNQWLKNKYVTTDNLTKAWSGFSTGNVSNSTIIPGLEATQNSSNFVTNPGFEVNGLENWVTEIHNPEYASISLDANEKGSGQYSARADILNPGDGAHTVQLKQQGIRLEKGKSYQLTFKAKSSHNNIIAAVFGMDTSPWEDYGLQEVITLDGNWKEYNVNFTSTATTDSNTRLSFVLGMNTGSIWIDDVALVETASSALKSDESLEKGNISRTEWDMKQNFSEKRIADNAEFYCYLEKLYYNQMISYIHNNLNVKIPVSGSSNYYGQPDLYAQTEGDFVSAHNYFDHPLFSNDSWNKNDFLQKNLSLLTCDANGDNRYSADSFIGMLSLSAIEGKPLIVSEWSHVFPNDYQYEMPALITAYSMLQDWDGIFVYSYASDEEQGKYDQNNYISNFFDVATNPGIMSILPSCSLAFLRGDIKPANKTLLLKYSQDDLFDSYRTQGLDFDYNIKGELPFPTVYHYKIRKAGFNESSTSSANELLTNEDIAAISSEKNHISDTNEICWDTQIKTKEYLKYNTSKFQGAVGFISGKLIQLNNMDLFLNTNCSVSLIALDNQTIDTSKEMLFTAVARQKNTAQQKEVATNRLTNWGSSPVINQPTNGSIKIKLNEPSKYKVYSLNSYGDRTAAISTTVSGNALQFRIGKDNTLWYEIVAE